MKVLIVAATFPELEPLMRLHGVTNYKEGITTTNLNEKNNNVHFLITGVGSVNTTYYLQRGIMRVSPDYCINAGIAGSFSPKIKIGDVVKVKKDMFSDLGSEDGEFFLSIDELKLGNQVVPNSPFNQVLFNYGKDLKEVDAITVNTSHGNENSINAIKQKLMPEIESMEGAAFMLTCHREKIKHIQIRAISNYIEKRNIANWNISLAITNLNNFLIEFLNQLK